MDIWKLVNDIAEAVKEQRETELDNLMSEIDAFHLENAIDKALATGDRVAFEKLVGVNE